MDDQGLNTVSKRLDWACETAGVSRRALSRLAGLQDGHVALITSGHVETPTGEVLGKITSVLGCSLDWLIRGVGERPRAETMAAAVAAARSSNTTEAA